MKKTIPFLFFIFFVECLKAQNFQFSFSPISSVSSPESHMVNSLNIYNDKLYVGGDNTFVFLTNGVFIQVFDNNSGDYINHIEKIKNIGNDMYIVGENFIINGISTNIAKYNGVSWEAISAFPGSKVNDIVEYNGQIYAIGHFSDGQGNIAKLSNGSWTSLNGNPSGGYNYIGLTVFNDELYAYGHFTTISPLGNNIPVKNIAKWNGSEWSTVGTQQPNNQHIRTLYEWNNKLLTSNYDIWDGNQWTSINKPSNGEESFGFTTYKNQLFSITFNSIYMYNTNIQQWESVIPSGVQIDGYPFGGILTAAPVENNTLFTSFGSINNFSIHKLTESALSTKDVKKNSTFLHPNPTKDWIYLENDFNSVYSVQLFSSEGGILKTDIKFPLDLRNYPKGVYFIKIKYKNGDYDTKKIIKN